MKIYVKLVAIIFSMFFLIKSTFVEIKNNTGASVWIAALSDYGFSGSYAATACMDYEKVEIFDDCAVEINAFVDDRGCITIWQEELGVEKKFEINESRSFVLTIWSDGLSCEACDDKNLSLEYDYIIGNKRGYDNEALLLQEFSGIDDDLWDELATIIENKGVLCGAHVDKKTKIVDAVESKELDESVIAIATTELSIKEYKCTEPGCIFESSRQSDVKRHEKSVHLDVKPYKCDEPGCNYSAAREDHLKKHKEAVHLGIKPYKCDEPGCHFSTAYKECLKNHKKAVHPNIRPYKCDESGCDYSALGERDLKRHLKAVHLGIRTHKCDEPGCDFSAPSEYLLRRHTEAKHLGIRYKCDEPECTYVYVYKEDLKKHKKSMHLGTRYKCDEPECDYLTAKKEDLKNHKETVHLGIKYKCDEIGCDFSTAKKSNLKRHKKSRHL